jgi:hypothetical protein
MTRNSAWEWDEDVAAVSAPVLPAGWAPLTIDQQVAVMRACDAAPASLLLRISTRPGAEYRVYRLDSAWAGLCVASVCDIAPAVAPRNRALLGLGATVPDVVSIVVLRVDADRRASTGGAQGPAQGFPPS